jgi:hypothetical protein
MKTAPKCTGIVKFPYLVIYVGLTLGTPVWSLVHAHTVHRPPTGGNPMATSPKRDPLVAPVNKPRTCQTAVRTVK